MPNLLGELVVQFGHGAFLDGLDGDVVGDGLACELGLGVVGRIDDFGLQFLAGFGAAQDVGESLHRILAADLDQSVLALNGAWCFSVVGRHLAGVGDLGPVAVD